MMLYIPTYPDLPLQSLAHIFGPKATYIDYYWDGQWQTSQLDVVLVINRAHAVLLRLRPSLLEALVECPGLDKEIKLQPRLSTRNKRAADDLVSPIKKVARVDVESAPSQSGGKGKEKATEIIIINSPSPPAQLSMSTFVPQTRPPKSVAPFPLDLPEPNFSKARKSFPRDYYVSEVIEGLRVMSQKMDADRISQRVAFSVVFPGVKYHKGQLSQTRTILTRAGDKLRRRFRKYGTTSDGTWANLKALLPKTILDKGFTDDGSIRALEVSEDDYSDGAPKQVIRFDDGNFSDDTSISSDESHSGPQCPFCDEYLKREPSDVLVNMLNVLLPKSTPDPSPSNPNHHKAKGSATIGYCSRHRMESDIFPTAEREGWPMVLDFAALYERVLQLDHYLRPLLEFELTDRNEFYKEVMKSFAPGTSKAAASSIGGQWHSFKGHGAG
jgi:hypothetical protein